MIYQNSTCLLNSPQYIVGPNKQHAPYTSLLEAVTQAVADGASTSNILTILVKPGSYLGATVPSGINIVALDVPPSEKGATLAAAQNLTSVTITSQIVLTGTQNHFCNLTFTAASGVSPVANSGGAGPYMFANCKFYPINASAIACTASAAFYVDDCEFGPGTASTTHGFFTSNNTLTLVVNNCAIQSDGAASTGTCNLTMFDSVAKFQMDNTGSGLAETILVEYCDWSSALAGALVSIDNTSPSTFTARYCRLAPGGTNVISNTNASSAFTLSLCRVEGLLGINASSTKIFIGNAFGTAVTTPGAYPYSVLASDEVVLVAASTARSIILPVPGTSGAVVTIKDSSGTCSPTNAITVTSVSGSIEGGSSLIMNVPFQALNFVSDGTNYWAFSGLKRTANLPVAEGGTGTNTLTSHGVVLGQGTTQVNVSAAGTAGQVFTSGGASADGSYQGIGANSGLTAHGVLLGEGASGFAATAAGTTGQLLRGVTGADPSWSNIVSMATGGVVFTQSAAGSTSIVSITNLDGAAGSSSHLLISTLNTTNSPYINYFNSSQAWSHGEDSADSNKFKITASPTPGGATAAISSTVAGNVNFPLTSCFLASLTTPQNNVTGDGTVYTVPFNNTSAPDFDQQSNYSNPNFTAPAAGKYLLGFCISLSGIGVANTNCTIKLVTTGNSFNLWQGNVGVLGSGPVMTGSQLCVMNPGDTASITVTVSGGTKIVGIYGDSLSSTNFWGQLIA